jgi:hypothetical protein
MESIARELFEHAQIKSDHTLALTRMNAQECIVQPLSSFEKQTCMIPT